MPTLPSHIAELAKKHNLKQSDFWNCHGTWVCKHAPLEKAAAVAGVKWAPAQILESDSGKAVAILATGSLGDLSEWSIGEASPKNNKNSYPWAMAEKRAKDRVILKLLGFSGDVYSEEEADDFKEAKPNQDADPNWARLVTDMKAYGKDQASVRNWWEGAKKSDTYYAIPEQLRVTFFEKEVKPYDASLAPKQVA